MNEKAENAEHPYFDETRVLMWMRQDDQRDQQRIDFVVKACGSHESLVALLKSARYYVVKAGTTGAFDLRDQIDAAIAGAL